MNDIPPQPALVEDEPVRRVLRGVSPALSALGQIERILGEFAEEDQQRMLQWLAFPFRKGNP